MVVRAIIVALAFGLLAACADVETAQAPDTLPPYKIEQVETLLETRLPGRCPADARTNRLHGPYARGPYAEYGHAGRDHA